MVSFRTPHEVNDVAPLTVRERATLTAVCDTFSRAFPIPRERLACRFPKGSKKRSRSSDAPSATAFAFSCVSSTIERRCFFSRVDR